MGQYQEHSLDGASAVDLVVVLYDGIIRFLYSAAEAADRGDTSARRAAVKRALDIIIHLQARLRMDIGGRPAQALSEFYASIFAQILRASQSASRAHFEHAIDCVKNVRDAWRDVAREPSVNPPLAPADPAKAAPETTSFGYFEESVVSSRWSA